MNLDLFVYEECSFYIQSDSLHLNRVLFECNSMVQPFVVDALSSSAGGGCVAVLTDAMSAVIVYNLHLSYFGFFCLVIHIKHSQYMYVGYMQMFNSSTHTNTKDTRCTLRSHNDIRQVVLVFLRNYNNPKTRKPA